MERIAISLVVSQYFVFDRDVIRYLRLEHHICGVLTGTLPQVPQQNVFMGLPLQLMPEEVKILVDTNVADVIDETVAHDKGQSKITSNDLRQALGEREKMAEDDAQNWKIQELERIKRRQRLRSGNDNNAEDLTIDNATFDVHRIPRKYTTPAVSSNVDRKASRLSNHEPPVVKSRLEMYKFLHDKGYFVTPGLRFGGQFMVYPGDPLRFHSHFIANGLDWEEEFDMLDVVSGGRLGTGVKKAWLLGGIDHNNNTCCFAIEWAGFG